MCAKQLHNIQHRSHLVRKKNRELLDQRPFQLGTRLRQVSSHLNSGSATKAHWPRQLKLSHCRCFVGKRNMLVWSLKPAPQATLHDLTWRSTRGALHSLSEYGRRKRADRAQTKKTRDAARERHRTIRHRI